MNRPLDDRLAEFANAVLRLADKMPKSLASRRLADQFIRSGTSVGANYEEATGAESRADFIHKLRIAYKEIRETCYWLRVISCSRMVPPELIDPIYKESLEIRAMLGKAVTTTKAKNGNYETMQL